MCREALGTDYGAAIERAELLNKHFDAWRQGQSDVKSLDHRQQVWNIGMAVRAMQAISSV